MCTCKEKGALNIAELKKIKAIYSTLGGQERAKENPHRAKYDPQRGLRSTMNLRRRNSRGTQRGRGAYGTAFPSGRVGFPMQPVVQTGTDAGRISQRFYTSPLDPIDGGHPLR